MPKNLIPAPALEQVSQMSTGQLLKLQLRLNPQKIMGQMGRCLKALPYIGQQPIYYQNMRVSLENSISQHRFIRKIYHSQQIEEQDFGTGTNLIF